MSTMLFDWSTGVSGLGRPGTAEQSGMTKRVKFSYNANSRRLATVDFEGIDVYAAIFLEFSFPTSYR